MAVTGLDAVESVQPDRHLHAQLGVTQPSQLVAVLQEPDRLAADLDRRGVAPTADLLVEQLVGFRGKRHVHGPDNPPDHTPPAQPRATTPILARSRPHNAEDRGVHQPARSFIRFNQPQVAHLRGTAVEQRVPELA